MEGYMHEKVIDDLEKENKKLTEKVLELEKIENMLRFYVYDWCSKNNKYFSDDLFSKVMKICVEEKRNVLSQYQACLHLKPYNNLTFKDSAN